MKKKSNASFKNANKANFKKYVDKNRDKWNLYLKKRQKFGSENLTDAYIRRLIRAKYKSESKKLIEKDGFVEKYREQIILKRSKKGTKKC